MLRLVGHVRAEVSAHDGMPGWVILSIKLLLDKGRDIFFNVVFLQGHVSAVDGVLLHILCHVSVLDDGFPFGLVGHRLKVKLFKCFEYVRSMTSHIFNS